MCVLQHRVGVLKDFKLHGHLTYLTMQVVDFLVFLHKFIVGVGLEAVGACLEESMLPGLNLGRREVVLASSFGGSR